MAVDKKLWDQCSVDGKVVSLEIDRLRAYVEGLCEVVALAAALREAGTLKLNAQEIEKYTKRLKVYADAAVNPVKP